MCTLDYFCCCCSLKTGMKYICTTYSFYFFLIVCDNKNLADISSVVEWKLFPIYVYGGLGVTILAWFGIIGVKGVFCVYPLLVYEIVLFIYRVVIISKFFNTHINQDEPPDNIKINIFFLVVQMYVILIEYSFIQEQPPPPPFIPFSPLAQNSTNIIISQPVSIAHTTAYPVEYSQQQPYFYPSAPQLFSHQMCHTQGVGNSLQNQQTLTRPFPYDAPPPYTEDFKTSAPAAECQ